MSNLSLRPYPALTDLLTFPRSKQQEAESSAKKWKKGAQDSFGSDQSFGHTLSHPRRPPSRPGTSHSTRSTILFRAPFANSAATSSMVDLAPPSPRRPSAASLRQSASSSNFKGGRPTISGPIGPPVSLPLGADPSQAGIPARPGTAGSMKKDWVNPHDIQFGKDMSSGRPHTSAGPSALKSPLNFEFDIGDGNDSGAGTKAESSIGPNGYPSPPPSVKSVEQGLTRVNTEPKLSQSSKPPAPSSLRRVNTADQNRLPSPAVSEERLDGPVVRNVQARRDTMTFHSPRRRSFAKNVDEGVAKREVWERTEQERAEIKKRRQTEGFEGNFSAFNFGGSAIDTSTPMPTDIPISPTTTVRHENFLDTKRASPPAVEKKSAQERGMSEPMMADAMDGDQKAGSGQADSPSWPSIQSMRLDGAPSVAPGGRRGHNTPSLDSLAKPTRPRVDSDTRCPDTPTALRAPPPVTDRVTIRSSQISQDRQSSDRLEEVPPPKLNPGRLSQSPLRSKPPTEGDFPVSKGLPRGRRPGSPESQRGRSPERFEEAPPPKLNPDRRSQSPLRARQPIEGNFPVSKGLPRGRRPGPGPAPIAPVPYGAGNPPPRPPRESEGVTTLPGWADRTDKHLSALPAPLSPMCGKTSFADSDLNSGAAKTLGAPTLGPPRLPSPTFSSLEESMSENFAKAFDDFTSADPAPPEPSKPLISPVLSEFGVRIGDGRASPIRVEAKKAPPRPNPITLPPSKGATPNGSVKSPTAGEFSPGFI